MIDINKIKEEQVKLAKKVIISDAFDKIETIAGVDQAFIGEDVISGIAVCSYKELMSIEKKYAVARAKIPYIPGFLFYREGPAIIEAFSKLENKPDILIVDGNGILHPRRFGMASHIGILLDTATIGVAKSLLFGEVKDNRVIIDKEVRGYQLVTREHAKPIFVSPGHKISLQSSVGLVKKFMIPNHKLPEPLHLAHKYVNTIREELIKDTVKH